MLIGEVPWMRIAPGGIAKNGALPADFLQVLSSLGLDAYTTVSEAARFAYNSSSVPTRSSRP